MRSTHVAVPLLLVTSLLACQPGDERTDSNDPLSPSAPAITPNFSAERFPFNFFLLQDFDRDISATVGLVSSPSGLHSEPDCGGTGPEMYDGGGIVGIVQTPSGSIHVRDRLQKATLVLYEGATEDVCELATHAVIARGPVNFNFSVHVSPDGTVRFLVQIVGMVELTSGGTAHYVATANYVFDPAGNLTVHVDRSELKRIGG